MSLSPVAPWSSQAPSGGIARSLPSIAIEHELERRRWRSGRRQEFDSSSLEGLEDRSETQDRHPLLATALEPRDRRLVDPGPALEVPLGPAQEEAQSQCCAPELDEDHLSPCCDRWRDRRWRRPRRRRALIELPFRQIYAHRCISVLGGMTAETDREGCSSRHLPVDLHPRLRLRPGPAAICIGGHTSNRGETPSSRPGRPAQIHRWISHAGARSRANLALHGRATARDSVV